MIRSIFSGDDSETTEDDPAYGYDEKVMGGEIPAGEDFPEEFSSSAARSGHDALDMVHGLDKEPFTQDNIIGMPGISSEVAEVVFMKPRSFNEMPQAIQALRGRRAIILNLTQMHPEEAQRAVDFVSGGNFATDGSQERLGEGIFLFAPSCVKVTMAEPSEPVPSPTPSAVKPQKPPQPNAPESPAYNSHNSHNSQPSSFVPEVNGAPFSGGLPPTV
ncbi:cell division protein SepF [Candidatus Synechococcus spongiarum]|uniref:Cell division protein SepF n=1 Tax=Candidatus Synechococcus spongiarum TaxID=431041 RepID=A0A164Y6H7_9SYNE|nr:CBSS-74546.3.peg.720: hypothetical protein [Candidatus Synechococcus spongiarum]